LIALTELLKLQINRPVVSLLVIARDVGPISSFFHPPYTGSLFFVSRHVSKGPKKGGQRKETAGKIKKGKSEQHAYAARRSML
jgi:hypothetical protein